MATGATTTTEKVPIVTLHVRVVFPNNIQIETVVQAPSTASGDERRRDYTVTVADGSRVTPQQETNAMASAEMVGHQTVERNDDLNV